MNPMLEPRIEAASTTGRADAAHGWPARAARRTPSSHGYFTARSFLTRRVGAARKPRSLPASHSREFSRRSRSDARSCRCSSVADIVPPSFISGAPVAAPPEAVIPAASVAAPRFRKTGHFESFPVSAAVAGGSLILGGYQLVDHPTEPLRPLGHPCSAHEIGVEHARAVAASHAGRRRSSGERRGRAEPVPGGPPRRTPATGRPDP